MDEFLSHHVESLVRKLSSLVTRNRVNPATLLIVFRRTLDFGNSLFQVIMHGPVNNGMPNIIAKVEGPYKEAINSRYLGYRINLCLVSTRLNVP